MNIWLRTHDSNFSYFGKCWITAGLVSTGLSVTKMTKLSSFLPKALGNEITSFRYTGSRIQQGKWLHLGGMFAFHVSLVVFISTEVHFKNYFCTRDLSR